MNQVPTLCWKCARAYPTHGCSWADSFEPVEGWTAEFRPVKYINGGFEHMRDSYVVLKCPLFEPEESRLQMMQRLGEGKQ